MKVTAKALEKGPGWVGTTQGGQGKVLGVGSGSGLEGRALLVRSPKVSVRCIGPVFTEDKRGARGSQGGPNLVGKGSESGRGGQERSRRGRDCLSVHYI